MAYQRYSVKEALNRIYRLWSGNDAPSDAPESIDGEIFSEDEAWSNISELTAGSLPSEVMFLPDAATMRYGQIYFSDSPATGTSVALVTGIWTTIDAFETDGLSSAGITPEASNHLIRVGVEGTYFVEAGVSYEGTAGTLSVLQFSVTLDGVQQNAVNSHIGLAAGGVVVRNCTAAGYVEIDAGEELELVGLAEIAPRTIYVHHCKIGIQRVGPKV